MVQEEQPIPMSFIPSLSLSKVRRYNFPIQYKGRQEEVPPLT